MWQLDEARGFSRRQYVVFAGCPRTRGQLYYPSPRGEAVPFSICFICACFNSAHSLLPARTASQIASCPDAFWLRRNTRDRSRRKNKVPEQTDRKRCSLYQNSKLIISSDSCTIEMFSIGVKKLRIFTLIKICKLIRRWKVIVTLLYEKSISP